MLPIDNLLFAIGTQFIVLAAIFATMSLLLAERDSGTLAWTISKPVSRTSVLVSKWLTATLVLWVAAVVIPMAVTTVLVTVLYGLPDLADRHHSRCHADRGAGVLRRRRARRGDVRSEPGRRRRDRPRGPAGAPDHRRHRPCLTPFFPGSIFDWAVTVSIGGPASLVTPVAWLGGMALLFFLARARLNATDL